jgi:hypothetical protein
VNMESSNKQVQNLFFVKLTLAAIMATGLIAVATKPTYSQQTVPTKYFKLQTQFLESKNKCLEGNQVAPGATLGGAAFMDTCQNVSGQMWKMVTIK